MCIFINSLDDCISVEVLQFYFVLFFFFVPYFKRFFFFSIRCYYYYGRRRRYITLYINFDYSTRICVCVFFGWRKFRQLSSTEVNIWCLMLFFFPAVAVVAPFWPPLLLLLFLSLSYFSLTCIASRKSGIVNCADKNSWWFDKVNSYKSSCNSKSHTLKWAEYCNKCNIAH